METLQPLEMDRPPKKTVLLSSLCCLLFIIGLACLILIFTYSNRLPNTTILFNHSRRTKFSAHATTELKGYHWDEQLIWLKGEKPWFMKNGTRWPTAAEIDQATGRRVAKLWPSEAPDSDRMINQFMFKPPDTAKPRPIKKILSWHGLIPWEYPKEGLEPFKECPVSNCMLITDEAEALEVDAILFLNRFNQDPPQHKKPSRQVWIMYTMESPLNTEVINREDALNWTATYMQSSDIVRSYGKWVYYDNLKTEWDGPPRNFSAGKTKKVAWFVSNSNPKNNRWSYAQELAQYIQVDIYGDAVKNRISHSRGFEMLDNDYKFYLAFENSNCREYITEKFFINGLQHKVIPIVMGAPREDYERIAPEGSFIHVEDFDSPKDLAAYLHKLDKDDDLYNSYFKWKGMGEVLIETFFYCRLCAMLNDDFPDKYYRRFNDFWRKPGSCITGYWRDYKRHIGGQLPGVSAINENSTTS